MRNASARRLRSEEHTSELQSQSNLVCRLLLEKKKKKHKKRHCSAFSIVLPSLLFFFFFFNDTATTEIYTLSLHDALPIWSARAANTGTASRSLSAVLLRLDIARELLGLGRPPLVVHAERLGPTAEIGRAHV